MRRNPLRGFALGVALALVASGVGWAHDLPLTDDGGVVIESDKDAQAHRDQHGGTEGHLPATSENVRLVGKMHVNQDKEGRVADVGVLGNTAYLAAWSSPNCQKGGIYVFDIKNPAAPKQINFIRTGLDSYAGEGVQALHLSTSAWTGDLLAFNNEDCTDNAGNTSKHSHGGFTLVDVTNPKTHKYLVEGFGDHDTATLSNEADAHEIHSIFVWEDENGTLTDEDDRAYAVVTDNEEVIDTDIFDITDPRNPTMVAEFDMNVEFPQIIQPDLGSGSSFLHDEIVKKIGNDYVMLLSYWDGGYLTLNVNDPANPVYIGDTDFANPDPELLESTGASLPPEGNGHQAEFSKDSDFMVVADEDFGPYAAFLSIAGGPSEAFGAGTATGPQLGAGETLEGGTRFVGEGCGALTPADADASIAVIERGTCTFQIKLDNASAAGYEAAIIVNNTTGSPNCEGLVGMLATTDILAYFVARSTGYAILGVGGYDAAACPAGPNPPLPAPNTLGEDIEISVAFDGWGYVHLYENESGKMTELDTYAIPEAHDEAKATGFGDLSVHEVAMSHEQNDLAYFSYYSGGFRVARIVDDELVEVGRFIDDGGNNFWGVQVWEHAGKEYVLASDRDYGLYIFEYTGPNNPNSN
jgi:hypothetical protein